MGCTGRSRSRALSPFALAALILMVVGILLAAAPQQAYASIGWPTEGNWYQSQGKHDRCAIDIAGNDGATVRAACGGTVTRIYKCSTSHVGSYGDCNGYGTGLVIRGDDGRWYIYAHMRAGSIPANVYYNAHVDKWAKLGNVGMTGCASGPHLHFGIHNVDPVGSLWYKESPYNPSPYGGTETYEWNPGPVKPDPASNVRLAKNDAGVGDTINVTWAAGARATSYTVALQCTTNGSYNQSKSSSGTSASFTLSNAGTYRVVVTASNSAGSSSATTSSNSCVVHPNCTVTYKDYDGAVLATKSVKWGGNATAPKSPTREGYTFQGWSSDGKSITSDGVITAQYTINTYTVKFEDYAGNAIGSLQKVEYKKAATPPSNVPTKDGYVFTNWSTEDYKCVTKNITVKAVYIWENVNLPIVTRITSAKRNSDATGYVISVNMTNFPDGFTTGKVVTALKTKAGKLVASDTRSVSPSAANEWSENITVLYSGVASTVEVSVLGVSDDETTGTPKSKAVSAAIDLGEEWSDWSANEPPTGSNIISESRTEYRAKQSKTIRATSRPDTPAGYTYTSATATGSYTGWGSWSGWSTSNPGSNDLRDVGSRTAYRYFVFLCTSCGTRDDLSGACSNCGRNTLVWTEEWDGTPGSSLGGVSWGNRYKVTRNGQIWYYEKPGTANGLSGSTGQVTRTEYHYRTRSQYYDYLYWQSNYSEWQAAAIASSSTCQVQTRTAYRFKTNSTEIPCYNYKRYKFQNLNTGKYVYTYTSAYADSQDFPGEWEYNTSYSELIAQATVDEGITLYNGYGEDGWYRADVNNEGTSTVYETTGSLEENTGIERTISGTAEGAAGKVATLVVYKGKNTDPTASQIEYVGQTTIANDGGYSFTFTTKEEPTIGTGDFVVTLGIEGATNYNDIGIIEAPKPSYVVEFVDDEGNQIGDSQLVLEGAAAVAPEVPAKEGYEFLNWDTGLSNVHDNMVITAQYKKKTCTVIFVDWDETDLQVAQFEYGDELKAESVPTKLGEKFAKWIDANGSEVTTVTKDMVVEASYNIGTYVVRFLDWDGNIVSEQEVTAGQSAVAPTLGGPSSTETFASWDTGGAENYVLEDLTVKPVAEYKQTSAAPSFSIADGTYSGAQTVSITCPNSNAEIYYEVVDPLGCGDESEDGSSASANGTLSAGGIDGTTIGELSAELYTGPITVSESATILAYTKESQKNNSDIEALNLVIEASEIPQTVLVSEITFDQTSLEMSVGDTKQLSATVLPENAANKAVNWRSTNSDVVTVDSSGNVVAVGAGIGSVIATAKDGSGVSAVCRITVEAAAVQKKTQTIQGTTTYSKTEGDGSFTLDARTDGDGALSYMSSNPDVASVSGGGTVSVGQAGTAVITITAAETDAYYEAAMTVVVSVRAAAIEDADVLVESIELSQTSMELTIGDVESLEAIALPSNAANKKLAWSSTNESVVKVVNGNQLLARKVGTATILVEAMDGSGVGATCAVVVKEQEKFEQVIEATTLYQKTTADAGFAIDARLTTGNGALSYESDDTNVATVDQRGNVTIKGAGIAIITVKAAETDDYKAASEEVIISVKKAPSGDTPANPDVITAVPQIVLTKTQFTYSGNVQKPALIVKVNDKVLTSDYYAALYQPGCVDVGTYEVIVTLKNGYEGYGTASFKIVKAANNLSVVPKIATVKYAKLKKKAQTIKLAKALGVKGNQGKVTYKKISGNKKITIKSSGKITVKKKGLKKGKSYPVTVRVTAAGDANHASASKTVVFKVKVK